MWGRRVNLGSWFLIGLAITRCSQSPYGSLASPSSVSVQATNSFPAVVEVILPQGTGLCSGTFIGPSAVLTADHCALQTGSYQVLTSFGVFSTNNVMHLGTGEISDTSDMAVLLFDQNVADPSQGQVINVGGTVSTLQVVQLVGFGCDNLSTEAGTGTKRTGTNQVYEIDDYIELITPQMPATQDQNQVQNRILGPSNRAGTCFGDSGGPLLTSTATGYQVAGITHSGGTQGDVILSQFINLNRPENQSFLSSLDSTYSLGIFGCSASSLDCNIQSAGVQIINFLNLMWMKLVTFFHS
jgi:V8-like Glu-specific endopeptidase